MNLLLTVSVAKLLATKVSILTQVRIPWGNIAVLSIVFL